MLEAELAIITEENNIPAWSMIELTYRCNLKCSHCYLPGGQSEKSGESGERELTTGEVKKVLDQLAEEGCLFLAFTGGEIFLRKDVFEILDLR